MPAAVVDIVRQEWRDSYRRLQEDVRQPGAEEPLMAQVDVITEELRRRVGQWFTLEELADAYDGADTWSRDVVLERAPAPALLRSLAFVEGAAFHLYSRGAVDYRP